MNYLRTRVLVYSDESSVFNYLDKHFKKSKDFWIEKSGKCKVKDITTSEISMKNHTELEIYYIPNKDTNFQSEMTRDLFSLKRDLEKLI
jgi:hypothetical protein